MTPIALLGYAQRLLDDLGEHTSGNSSRLAALLARQALEVAIDLRCAELGAECPRSTMRSRLVILRGLGRDAAVADRCTSLWHQLSAACHQHAYQLAPTAGEVRSLCAGVAVAIGILNSEGIASAEG
ncbi:hypothetical protein GCM10009624_16150 [Gordonia sinesedis]